TTSPASPIPLRMMLDLGTLARSEARRARCERRNPERAATKATAARDARVLPNARSRDRSPARRRTAPPETAPRVFCDLELASHGPARAGRGPGDAANE